MVFTIENLRKTLETYSIEEIAEYNDVQLEDLLEMLVDEYNWQLPDPEPLS